MLTKFLHELLDDSPSCYYNSSLCENIEQTLTDRGLVIVPHLVWCNIWLAPFENPLASLDEHLLNKSPRILCGKIQLKEEFKLNLKIHDTLFYGKILSCVNYFFVSFTLLYFITSNYVGLAIPVYSQDTVSFSISFKTY